MLTDLLWLHANIARWGLLLIWSNTPCSTVIPIQVVEGAIPDDRQL